MITTSEPRRGVRALSPRGLVAPRLGASYVRDARGEPGWKIPIFTVLWTNLILLRGPRVSPSEVLRY